ncbi:MAG: hypothetical protein ACPGYL_07780 [Rhodospirillaceae bacterium]
MILLTTFYFGINVVWNIGLIDPKIAPFKFTTLRIAEKELNKMGLPRCPVTDDYHLRSRPNNPLHCAWWRLPTEKNQYCGKLYEIFKPGYRCYEVIFESKTPKVIMDVFQAVLDNPCKYLVKQEKDIAYEAKYDSLHCAYSNGFRMNYRHFTSYVITIDEFKGDIELFYDLSESEVISVKKRERTEKWLII